MSRRLKVSSVRRVWRFCSFRVPVGTTPELQDLLFGLLRRNAKERMPFDAFFNHPFLQRHPPAQQQQAAGEKNMTLINLCLFLLTSCTHFLQLTCRPLLHRHRSPTTPPTLTFQLHRTSTTTSTIIWKLVSDLGACQNVMINITAKFSCESFSQEPMFCS